MTIRLTFLADNPSKCAHASAASRLSLELAQTGKVGPALLSYGDDPVPSWLPPAVRVDRLSIPRISQVLPSARPPRTWPAEGGPPTFVHTSNVERYKGAGTRSASTDAQLLRPA